MIIDLLETNMFESDVGGFGAGVRSVILRCILQFFPDLPVS